MSTRVAQVTKTRAGANFEHFCVRSDGFDDAHTLVAEAFVFVARVEICAAESRCCDADKNLIPQQVRFSDGFLDYFARRRSAIDGEGRHYDKIHRSCVRRLENLVLTGQMSQAQVYIQSYFIYPTGTRKYCT